MTRRNFFRVMFTAGICLLCLGSPSNGEAQTQDITEWHVGGYPRTSVANITKILEEEIETKHFQKETPLASVLEVLREMLAKRGKKVLLVVDAAAFKREDAEAADVRETKIAFHPFPKRMRLATVLRLAISKVDPPAGYRVKRGMIEITTISRINSLPWLLEEPVVAQFKNTQLRSREIIIWSISFLARSYSVIPFSMKLTRC